MAATTKIPDQGAGGERPEGSADAAELEVKATPAPSLAGAVGDRCGACGTRLAGDQRYCLECGERRGAARFAAIPHPPSGGARDEAPPPRHGSRLSPAMTLIAGVGTLLLAMGIGVLIGTAGNSQPVANGSKVQVVTVGGGSGASAASGSATTRSTPVSSTGSHKSRSKRKSSRPHAAAAAQTTSTAANPPPPTVTVGAKGHGAGYQHGKFTGNFFGP